MTILLIASLATTAPLIGIWLGEAQLLARPFLSCWPPTTSRSAGGPSPTARATSSSTPTASSASSPPRAGAASPTPT